MEKEVKEKRASHLLILLDASSPVQVAPTIGGTVGEEILHWGENQNDDYDI